MHARYRRLWQNNIAMRLNDKISKNRHGLMHVVAKVRARQNAKALLKLTQVECQKRKLKAEQKATVMIKGSEAALKVVESQAASVKARAEVEAEGADALAERDVMNWSGRDWRC